ncbi:hypothetical protein ACIBTV_31110 [Micromonospora sp. NPDC049366]|uniref:hypothetical protein n=1 Tax=Micromonospora sp. NPDC049366 TaxID=3364271 RepID=UPI0037B6CCCE
MRYHLIGLTSGEFLTVRANDRPHILVFHDMQLAVRCMDTVCRAWPESGAALLLTMEAPSRAEVEDSLRSTPGIPADLTVLFVDNPLFLDLVEELARLSRAVSDL